MHKRRGHKFLAFSMLFVLVFTMSLSSTTYASADGVSLIMVQAESMRVKTTGTNLNEGQLLSKASVRKCVRVTTKFNTGSSIHNYKDYNIQNAGKTIKPNSKGYYKVTLTTGTIKKTVAIKVNRIKKIYIKKNTQKALTEGTKFDANAFKKCTTVYADYVKGSDKKLTTYTVSAPKIVKADKNGKFYVTIKFRNQKARYGIKVNPHVHKWEPIIKHHKAVYETKITPAVVHYYRCYNCGCTYPTVHEDPCEADGTVNGASCQVVISPYKEEQVLVQEAYDEVTGYRCSCGTTKEGY